MRRVIKHIPSGRYFSSTKLLVDSPEFARRFNSVKAARDYIYRNSKNYPRSECKVMLYYRDKTTYVPDRDAPALVAQRIMNKFWIEEKRKKNAMLGLKY